MPLPSLPRRRFLRWAAGATALTSLAHPLLLAQAPRRAFAAAEDLRLAVIGLRIKGNQHCDHLLKQTGVRLIAVCDADTEIMAATVARLSEAGHRVDSYQDFRKLLERSDLDAVIVATPNHTHTLITLWALNAGKDVYVEKPVSHTLEESVALAEAVRRSGRIVQAGTQRRSDPAVAQIEAALRSGEFGKIHHVHGICYKRRPSIGWTDQPVAIPPSVDLDLTCGPAPLQAPVRQRFHYDWHWSWEMGNGEIGNQGPHELDIARRLLGATHPHRVVTVGGRWGERDNGETPNTQLTWFDFPEAPLLFEIRGLPRSPGSEAENAYLGVRIGVAVACEAGTLMINNSSATLLDSEGHKVRRYEGDGGLGHLANFLQAVRSGRAADLNAPIHEAVLSADLVHLANLAYRTGATARPDEIAATFRGYAHAESIFTALHEHARPFNGSGDQPLEWRQGGWLGWNAVLRRFEDAPSAEAANLLRGRTYRSGWALPTVAA